MNTTHETLHPHQANRKTAVIVGILFILGTVSGILSGVVSAPIRAGSTYPLNISAGETPWILGTLLVLLMGLSLAMVPVLLYPICKKHNEVLAFGAVLFREVLEAVCEILLVISMFLLLTVSEIYGKAGAADASTIQTLGSGLVAAGEWIQMTGGIVFSVGTLMIFALFYQTRLIPRWLSGWGLLGAVLYCQCCKHVWSAAPGSRNRCGNRAVTGPNCHSRNGLWGLDDRQGIQSVCNRLQTCPAAVIRGLK